MATSFHREGKYLPLR